MKRNFLLKSLKRNFGGKKGLPNFENDLMYDPKLSQEISSNFQNNYALLPRIFENKSL